MNICIGCGGEFHTKRKTAKFCTDTCGQRYRKAKHKLPGQISIKLTPADTIEGTRRRVLHTLADRYGWVCWYCGQDLKGLEIQIDHVIPKCRGGADDISNYALVCEFCNRAKLDHDLDVFLSWLDQVRFGRAWTPITDGSIRSYKPGLCGSCRSGNGR